MIPQFDVEVTDQQLIESAINRIKKNNEQVMSLSNSEYHKFLKKNILSENESVKRVLMMLVDYNTDAFNKLMGEVA